MSSPSETTLIVLAAASAAQLIQPETAAFWQIVTAIGLTITPLLAQLGRIAARRVDLQGEIELPVVQPGDKAAATVIIGFGRVGRLVAEMLSTHGRTYIGVDSNIDTRRRRPARRLSGNVWRHRPTRPGREAEAGTGERARPDDGRTGIVGAARAAGARGLPGSADHRPCPRFATTRRNSTGRARPTPSRKRSKPRFSYRRPCWSISASRWAR